MLMRLAAQVRNMRSFIGYLGRIVVEYVKGAEPDRWHWLRECKQYPYVVMSRRSNRPSSDLCDECLDLERVALRQKAAA